MSRFTSAIRKIQVATYPDPSISPEIKPLSHNYPWQIYTRWNDIQLTAKLEHTYPVDALKRELGAILAEFAPAQQFGQYHMGGWGGVALHAVDGNPLEDQDYPDARYAKTAAMELAPTMEKIVDSFPCEKRRVRILQLEPGRKIFWHQDYWHSIDSPQIRLHIPITTNENVGFQISHVDCAWQPGELWYGDFTFPHRLQNGGDESRIHLVIDLVSNSEILAMMPGKLIEQSESRRKARQRCNQLMRLWGHAFATERRLLSARSARLS